MHTETNAVVVLPSTDVAANVPAVVAAKPAKRASKPKAAKPAKPAAPVAATPAVVAKPAKPDNTAAIAADEKRCADLRALAATYYAGASNAAHQRKPAKRDDYASRITTPVQRIGNGGPSTRDESGLALILSNAKRDGSFDPTAINLDLGIASRLASVGMLAFANDTFTLTKAGRERANLVVKRAA